jgi:hypothetical protein
MPSQHVFAELADCVRQPLAAHWRELDLDSPGVGKRRCRIVESLLGASKTTDVFAEQQRVRINSTIAS